MRRGEGGGGDGQRRGYRGEVADKQRAGARSGEGGERVVSSKEVMLADLREEGSSTRDAFPLISPLLRIDAGKHPLCCITFDESQEGLMACATKDTVQVWGGVGIMDAPRLVFMHKLPEAKGSRISHISLQNSRLVIAGKLPTTSGKRKKTSGGILSSIAPSIFASAVLISGSGPSPMIASVELPICTATWESFGGMCLVPGHGLSMLAGEAREGGGIVEVLLDGELLGDGADGSHGKQTQRYESEMIVRTKRCVSLPGAAGYGCMVGLAIASGRETIAVGALSSGIAVWDLGRHVLLSVVPSTQVSTQIPPPSITGISPGSLESTVAVCLDASRERGGTRARRSTQSSQPWMLQSQQREGDGNALISQPQEGGTSQGIRSQKSTSQSPCSPTRQLPPAVGNILSVCPDSGSLQVVVRLVAHEEVQCDDEAKKRSMTQHEEVQCDDEASAAKKRSKKQYQGVQRGDGEGKCEPVHARGASVCSSGLHVAVACSGGGTFVWEVETGRQAASLHAKPYMARPAETAVQCIALSNVSAKGDKIALPVLALGMGEGRVDVWSS